MNSNRNKRICIALATALALSAASGCSVREYAARSIGDAMASGGEVYASDNDIELVGVATPFGLKTMESLLAVVPDHRGRGISRLLLHAILAHPDLKDVRLFRLATKDAHGLYAKYGFKSMVNPDKAMELFVDALE